MIPVIVNGERKLYTITEYMLSFMKFEDSVEYTSLIEQGFTPITAANQKLKDVIKARLRDNLKLYPGVIFSVRSQGITYKATHMDDIILIKKCER